VLPALAAARPGLTVIGLDPGLPVPEQAGAVPAAAATALARPAGVHPDDAAYVLFTSGSTGRPKGVPVTHANMAHFLAVNRPRYGLSPSDACSQTFDCTFDLAMFDMFVTWSAGAVLVSTPPQVFLALPEFAARQGLTMWFSVPSAIALVRRRGGLTAGSLPSLRWSLFCGEPLLMADAASWQAAAPRARVENLYGPTELTIACSAYRWDPAASPALCANGVVPVGPLYPGLRGVLVGESGEVSDSEGELCVSGPQMFPGYLDPHDDEARFTTLAGTRWYRTGDLMSSSAGAGLSYLGRVDTLVKIRGYRVELAELEWHARAVPGVERAVVVPVDGADSRRLFAWYCGEPGSAGPIREHLRTVVPEFMVPHWIRSIDQLPLNANRKVDRAALAGLAQRAVADLASAQAG
jgi:acyl-CoA synthetase (AMP-forming)/AMP-acid ligase II